MVKPSIVARSLDSGGNGEHETDVAGTVVELPGLDIKSIRAKRAALPDQDTAESTPTDPVTPPDVIP